MIWVHEYTLTPLAPLNALTDASPRRGALLRVDDGFADVYPWAELGDAPLDEQLGLLSRNETTPLTRRSLAMARLDGAARAAAVSLFDGLGMTENHWPLAAGDVPRAFDTVKIKLGPGGVIPGGLGGLKLRIDFNATLTRQHFAEFVNTLTRRNTIEFIEDPLPYDAATWTLLQTKHGIPFALDRRVAIEGVDVLVVKPAVQDVEEAAASGLDLVVTSYMDHPVGVMHAAYAAAALAARYPELVRESGLLTHLLYQPNAFSERLQLLDTAFAVPAGTGIGFDDLLEALPWKRLS